MSLCESYNCEWVHHSINPSNFSDIEKEEGCMMDRIGDSEKSLQGFAYGSFRKQGNLNKGDDVGFEFIPDQFSRRK